MKKVLLFSFIILSLFGCSYPYYYNYTFRMERPVVSKELTYSDDNIEITYELDDKLINFTIKNKTGTPLKINWDDLAYIDPFGYAKRVVHSSVKIVNRFEPQATTVIPAFAKYKDFILPAENIYFGEYLKDWIVLTLFPGEDKQIYYNKTFGVYFPILKGKDLLEYYFVFSIQNIEKVYYYKIPIYELKP